MRFRLYVNLLKTLKFRPMNGTCFIFADVKFGVMNRDQREFPRNK